MKKAFLIMAAISLIALLVTSVVPSVSAHPGRTDSKGGHNNRSTGEYHYHHGYPEHDHYDMDGDGEIDCPYDFVDQPDHDQNNSRGITSGSVADDIEAKGMVIHKKILPCLAAVVVSIPFLLFCAVFPGPISIIIGWLSELSGGTDGSYRFWTVLFMVVMQILIVYRIIIF